VHIISNAFKEGELIPAKYTCDGENISPLLQIEESPRDTKYFALIMDDPDSKEGTFTHWIIYNIPANLTELPERLPDSGKLPDGSCQGINDFGKSGYGGPCPGKGRHRYVFKLYALDSSLNPVLPVSRASIDEVLKGHIIAQANLIGLYERKTSLFQKLKNIINK